MILRPGAEARPVPWLAVAALYVAAELAVALGVGRFFEWGRAELLAFLAFRPWLLLIAALLLSGRGWRGRFAAYGAALILAASSQALLLLALGAPDPAPGILRCLAAGALLALAIDTVLQTGRRLRGRTGRSVAAALLVLAFLVPGGLRPYEAVALGPSGDRPAAERPDLLLMTALPIVWGESGPFDPNSRPAASYLALGREFSVRPIDHLDEQSLDGARLMLLAQPRALAPEELVALDSWVRGGGRVLVLADAQLEWPTRLPLGDMRRPPPSATIGPLLAHWGLRLEVGEGPRLLLDHVHQSGHARRLSLAAPGRFEATGPGCRIAGRPWAAECRLGAGRAFLVADADLLHDRMWTAPVPGGDLRHARTADNPLILAGWLDRLIGVERERAARPVSWLRPGAPRLPGLLAALAPILLAGLLQLALKFIHRPRRQEQAENYV